MHKKHVLITGASRGIGAACAFTFAAHGYHVFLNCNKSIDALQKVADSITQQGGICTLVPGDVGNPDTVRAIFEKISTIAPGLDVLINNAGISYVGLLTDMSNEEWMRILNTNLSSAFYCSRSAIPYMVRQKSGKIINISSVSGILGNVGQANYAASKAGVIGLTKTMARELGSRGITVNAIAPGFVDTEMTEVLSEEIRENACKQIILGRFGKPEDIANVAVFLASDKADYITGQVISVDGGMNV